MADIEFYFDPVCPWAWLTSRWVEEVAQLRDFTVDWKFISLRILNEDKDYVSDFAAGYIASHGSGLKLLRVLAAMVEDDPDTDVSAWYRQFAGDIHVRGRREEIFGEWETGFPAYLQSVGVAERYVGAANHEERDMQIRASTAEGLERVGKDVGTPIVTFNEGETSSSFFGPVISRVPRGAEALELWDAVWKLSSFPDLPSSSEHCARSLNWPPLFQSDGTRCSVYVSSTPRLGGVRVGDADTYTSLH